MGLPGSDKDHLAETRCPSLSWRKARARKVPRVDRLQASTTFWKPGFRCTSFASQPAALTDSHQSRTGKSLIGKSSAAWRIECLSNVRSWNRLTASELPADSIPDTPANSLRPEIALLANMPAFAVRIQFDCTIADESSQRIW